MLCCVVQEYKEYVRDKNDDGEISGNGNGYNWKMSDDSAWKISDGDVMIICLYWNDWWCLQIFKERCWCWQFMSLWSGKLFRVSLGGDLRVLINSPKHCQYLSLSSLASVCSKNDIGC